MDILSPEERGALMSLVRSTNTKPELAVRRALHAQGYRYRLHGRGLPGRPDLVFAKRRVAVFVHGCFWHRHDGCPKSRLPKTRRDYWRRKFDGNVVRDQRNERQLVAAGWRVFVAWECEIQKDATLLDRLMEFLGPAALRAAARHGRVGKVVGPASSSSRGRIQLIRRHGMVCVSRGSRSFGD